MTSALVCSSCAPGVKENAAISLDLLQSADILGLIICFGIHFHCLNFEYYPNTMRPGISCTFSALVCTSCTVRVQENIAIGLVVLQYAEILGLIICFAIHFLCVTIEYYP